jgi:tetratricopeptide (TPR) repeat protein
LGNYAEQKRLLTYTLGLERRSGDDRRITQVLIFLSNVNRLLDLREEGIGQAKEALEISERIGTEWETACLHRLAWLLIDDKQLDAAENAASRAITLIPKERQEDVVCGCHRVLGKVYQSKGDKKKAIQHFEAALRTVSPFDQSFGLFWIHLDLAELFLEWGELVDANTHVEQAKSHIVNNSFGLGRAMYLEALVRNRQLRFEDAKSEASHALEIFEKLGAAKEEGLCRGLLQIVEQKIKNRPISPQGENLKQYPTYVC